MLSARLTERRLRLVKPGLLAFAFVAALVAFPLAAYSSSSAKPSSAPSQIRIAYQLIPNGDLIVKDKRWLERLSRIRRSSGRSSPPAPTSIRRWPRAASTSGSLEVAQLQRASPSA